MLSAFRRYHHVHLFDPFKYFSMSPPRTHAHRTYIGNWEGYLLPLFKFGKRKNPKTNAVSSMCCAVRPHMFVFSGKIQIHSWFHVILFVEKKRKLIFCYGFLLVFLSLLLLFILLFGLSFLWFRSYECTAYDRFVCVPFFIFCAFAIGFVGQLHATHAQPQPQPHTIHFIPINSVFIYQCDDRWLCVRSVRRIRIFRMGRRMTVCDAYVWTPVYGHDTIESVRDACARLLDVWNDNKECSVLYFNARTEMAHDRKFGFEILPKNTRLDLHKT